MYFKDLTGLLPIEIVKEICDYDDRYKLIMKDVIMQIEKLNKEVEEYWNLDETLYYMTENEERYRLKLGLPISPMKWPLPKKRCFRFWNTITRGIPTLAEVTRPRDHCRLYELKHNP